MSILVLVHYGELMLEEDFPPQLSIGKTSPFLLNAHQPQDVLYHFLNIQHNNTLHCCFFSYTTNCLTAFPAHHPLIFPSFMH